MASDMHLKRKLGFVDGGATATLAFDKKARCVPDEDFKQVYGYASVLAKPEEVYVKEETFDELGYNKQIPTEEQPLNLALSAPRIPLIDHQAAHTGHNLSQCAFFHYQNSHRIELMDHRSIHTGGFSCKLCDFKCEEKSELNFHQKAHVVKHPFSCTNCDFQCFKIADLVSHQSVYMCNKKPNLIKRLNIQNF